MTHKLKNRIQKMNFQKQNRRVEVQNNYDDKYYEKIYAKKTKELIGTVR